MTAPDDGLLRSGVLPVGDGHVLAWETRGNPAGTPLLHLHGGPGSGRPGRLPAWCDPEAYHAVLFDQRGCGQSTPLAGDPATDLSTNTTPHLVADIERLREHLGVDRWLVAGGSWGVTLALVYAQQHPDRVLGMVLGAVTNGSRRELDWITRDVGRIFPREWEHFVSVLPETERDGNIPAAYSRLLADPDPQVRDRAAREWCAWEDTHVSLTPGWTPDPGYEDPQYRYQFARLVTHYWGNDCFLEDGQILRDVHRLGGIAAVLVHGRLDVSGPLDTAWRLHRAWPGSRLQVLEGAGHGGPGYTDAMRAGLLEVTPPRG